MYSDQVSLSARVSASYLELSSIASDLNAISDALGKAVSDIDEGLKKLNIGVTAWVRVDSFYGGEHRENRTYRIEEVGYSKFNGKWGIGLRTRSGDEAYPDELEAVEEWAFNEAARTLRLRAIEKIPELLMKLSEEAAKVTKELKAKLAHAQAVAGALQATGSGQEVVFHFPGVKPAETVIPSLRQVNPAQIGGVQTRLKPAGTGLKPAETALKPANRNRLTLPPIDPEVKR